MDYFKIKSNIDIVYKRRSQNLQYCPLKKEINLDRKKTEIL